MDTKTCSKCGKTKKLSDFYKRGGKRAHLYHSWCKTCKKGHDNFRYATNPKDKARIKRNSEAVRAVNQELLWQYLLTHPCVDCGNADPRVLELDHRDETTKSRNVTEMLTWGWDRVLEEIAKCDSRCANCHMIRTQVQFNTWRHLRFTAA